MALTVRLTLRAIGQLAEIRSYIIRRSPKGAEAVRADIRRTIWTLARHSGIGRPTEFPGLRYIATRKFAYIIYYTVQGRNPIIVHARHRSRAAPSADELA